MENEIKKKSFFQKKLFLFAILPLFAIGLVVAGGYIVSTLTLTVGVSEPFTVQYAFLGDAGTYTNQTCANATGWFNSTNGNIPTGNMYAGESRFVCVKITNQAEASLPYTINSTVTNDNENKDCAKAFGLPIIVNGTVDANAHGGTGTVKIDGALVQAQGNATPVVGCNVLITVARG
jgi:hypothetical protein